MPVAIEKIAVLSRHAAGCAAVLGGGISSAASVSAVPVKAAIVRRCAAQPGSSPLPLQSTMANIHSQKKRILRSERERLENRLYTSTIKTYFRRLEELAPAARTPPPRTSHRELVSTIDKAVKRGALHRNTGARKKSRAARRPRRR